MTTITNPSTLFTNAKHINELFPAKMSGNSSAYATVGDLFYTATHINDLFQRSMSDYKTEKIALDQDLIYQLDTFLENLNQ